MPQKRAKRSRVREDPRPDNDMRKEAISAVVGALRTKFGGDSASILTDCELFSRVKDFISTQAYGLDFALHLPGLPTGRSITIVGAEASGKSTLACHILAETQARGGYGVLLDTEAAFDEDRAARMGVDPAALIIVQPETVEEATAEIDECITSVIKSREKYDIDMLVTIVWDSVAGTPTASELGSEPGAVQIGPHAKALSATMRRLTRRIAKERILLVFVNQEKERVEIRSWGGGGGGKGKTMLAERPLGFHSSVILTCHRTEILRRGASKTPYAIRSRIKVLKNKKAAPFSEAEIVINFDNGIDRTASILSVALLLGIVVKDKGWYKFGDRRFRMSQFADLLAEKPEIMEKLEEARKTMTTVVDESGDDDDDLE